MLELLFSFSGRIGRLRYFLSYLGVVAGAVVLAVMFLVGAGYHPGAPIRPTPVLFLALLLMLVAIPVFLWVGLALQAKRFRDIGWNPLYVIPGLIVLGVFDYAIAHVVPALAMGRMHNQTLFGGLLNLASGCALLFWPGRSGDDDITPDAGARWLDASPSPARPSPAHSSLTMPAAPVHRAAPVHGGASAPSFGRRGL